MYISYKGYVMRGFQMDKVMYKEVIEDRSVLVDYKVYRFIIMFIVGMIVGIVIVRIAGAWFT